MQRRTLTRRMLGTPPLLALAGALLASCTGGDGTSSASGSTPTLYFSAIPDANKSELAEGFGRVAAYLSEQLEVPVEYRPAADYAASVEAFKNGDIQLAWFGGVSGVQARSAVAGSRAIAQGKVDPEYVSYFIVNAATGITPGEEFPMELEGKSFTFGSSGSTSGRVMPEYFIRQATGKAPADFFGHPDKFSGAHDATAKAVEAGTVDAGALSYKKYDSMVAAGELDPAKCVNVWTTPPYPDYNWTAHPALEQRYGAGFIEKVKAALVGMTDPALLEVMLRPEGLIPASNEDFDPIAETMAAVGM